jgi:hypothetical protein
MLEMCPECSHLIYGYDNCQHAFEEGCCKLCGWDGSRSRHTQRRFLENRRWGKNRPRIDALITATEHEEIRKLETAVGMTVQEACTIIIERTNWGTHTFPDLQGGKGTVSQRRLALLARWDEWTRL